MRIKILISIYFISSTYVGLSLFTLIRENIKKYYYGYCADQEKYLSDDELIDSMIANIIRKGDAGKHKYKNKEEYLDDIKDCCDLSRRLVFMEYRQYMRYIISISRSYRTYRSDRYSFIESYFDECGKEIWKPLTGG